jgi:hypothetical protein
MEETIVIPLKTVFRVWGRAAFEKAYRLRHQLELAEPESSEHLMLTIQLYFWFDLARRTAWRELACQLYEVTSLRSPVEPGSRREVIGPDLLKTLSPDHERSSAKNDHVEFLEIQIRGQPPIDWPSGMGRDEFVWGPFDSKFIHANDYEDITFKGESIRLQAAQAEMIRQLHKAHLEGRPNLAIKRLVPSGHISSYFKGQKANLLRYPKRGFVQLNLG